MVRIITVAGCLVLLGAPARPFAQTPVSTLEKSLDYFRSLGNYQLEAAIGGPLEK